MVQATLHDLVKLTRASTPAFHDEMARGCDDINGFAVTMKSKKGKKWLASQSMGIQKKTFFNPQTCLGRAGIILHSLLWVLICSSLLISDNTFAHDNKTISAEVDLSVEEQISLRMKMPTSRAAYEQLEIARKVPWERYIVMLEDISRFGIAINDPGDPQPYICNSETNECSCKGVNDCIEMGQTECKKKPKPGECLANCSCVWH